MKTFCNIAITLAAGLGLIGPASAHSGLQAEEVRPVEAVSLRGVPLTRPVLDPEFAARHQGLLEEARSEFDADPGNADALVWIGRRLAYLGRIQEAIETYREGAKRFPNDARFLRHLGHRLISTRHFGEAETILQKAATMTSGRPNQVEPDGLPNAAGVPTGTLKGNIWYHLGLARYLLGDFSGAAGAYATAAALAANPDAMTAARYWLYLCHFRAGDDEGARAALEPVTGDLELIENFAYHRLALVFRGDAEAEALLTAARADGPASLATTGYGIAMKRLIDGDAEAADRLLGEILAADDAWLSFGYIAAEAEIARGGLSDAN